MDRSIKERKVGCFLETLAEKFGEDRVRLWRQVLNHPGPVKNIALPAVAADVQAAAVQAAVGSSGPLGDFRGEGSAHEASPTAMVNTQACYMGADGANGMLDAGTGNSGAAASQVARGAVAVDDAVGGFLDTPTQPSGQGLIGQNVDAACGVSDNWSQPSSQGLVDQDMGMSCSRPALCMTIGSHSQMGAYAAAPQPDFGRFLKETFGIDLAEEDISEENLQKVDDSSILFRQAAESRPQLEKIGTENDELQVRVSAASDRHREWHPVADIPPSRGY